MEFRLDRDMFGILPDTSTLSASNILSRKRDFTYYIPEIQRFACYYNIVYLTLIVDMR